jgi:hypothetical protein
VKRKEGGRSQHDGNTEQPSWPDDERTKPGDDPIHRAEIRCPVTATIQDHQLVLQEKGFGHNCTTAARSHQSRDSNNQVDEQDGEITHCAIIVTISAGMTRLE